MSWGEKGLKKSDRKTKERKGGIKKIGDRNVEYRKNLRGKERKWGARNFENDKRKSKTWERYTKSLYSEYFSNKDFLIIGLFIRLRTWFYLIQGYFIIIKGPAQFETYTWPLQKYLIPSAFSHFLAGDVSGIKQWTQLCEDGTAWEDGLLEPGDQFLT